MGLWPTEKLGDIDDFFAFTTPKQVKIRDYRLGTINYALQFGIFLYIVVSAVFLQQGYLEFEPVFPGAVSISARRNSQADATANFSYCCYSAGLGGSQADWSANNACDGEVTGPDVHYQSTNNGAFPCLYWPDDHVIFQTGLDTSVALATRVGISTNTRCNLDHYYQSCLDSTNSSDETMYYIAGLEHFTLRVRHGVAGQGVQIDGQNVGSNRINGQLLNRDNDVITVATSNDAGEPGTEFTAQYGDQMSVSEILSAADISLDAVRSDPANASKTSTIRWDGINVVMYIQYYLKPFTQTLAYNYRPRILSDLEYKIEQLNANENSTTEEVFNRHGVRILLVQTGRLGRFSFQALLITLVSALGLLAVSATIVNLVMTKLLPMAPFYLFSKMEITEDFSVIRDAAKEEDFGILKTMVKDANRGNEHRSRVLHAIDAKASGAKEDQAVADVYQITNDNNISTI